MTAQESQGELKVCDKTHQSIPLGSGSESFFSHGLSYCVSSLSWNWRSSFIWVFLSPRIWYPFRLLVSIAGTSHCCKADGSLLLRELTLLQCRAQPLVRKLNALVLHHPLPVSAYRVFWRREWNRKLWCGSHDPTHTCRSVLRHLHCVCLTLEISLYSGSAYRLHLLFSRNTCKGCS